MIKLIRDNRLFFILCLVWFAAAGIPLLFVDKGAFSLFLNKYHSPVLDFFFRYATWMGDGLVIGIVCLMLFFVKFRYAIITSVVSFLSAWFVSLIKHAVDEERPSLYFKGMQLNYVKGIELYQRMSFPSGHTAAAFTLFLLFVIFSQNKKYTWVCFTLAVLVAISRVYLLQHFEVDVFFGSLFGVVFTLILYYLLNITPLFKGKWSEGSLITVFNKKRTPAS